MGPITITLLAIAFVLVVTLISCVHIVPQARAFVIERLGAYSTTWKTGLHLKLPFIERVAKKISLMEQVVDFPPQPVITKDNVRMQIDTVVFYQITDCKLFAYGVQNPMAAIENLTATTLRNIIGELELDQTLTSRDIINAMEKQMKAERERRELILRAEGEKNSAILVAEGRKQSVILDAEAAKQSQILAAEANKEARIKEAEGEAEAILKVQKATAEGIAMINEANPSKAVLTIKSLEAFEKAADGKATKIIIPSEIQGMAGLASSAAEIFKSD